MATNLLMHLRLLLCILLFSATVGCQAGAEADRGLDELELTRLAPGLSELFGAQPEQGALLLYEAQGHASWVIFDDKETCLFVVERNISSKSSRPIPELGRDDLNAGIGCDPSDEFRNEGTFSFSTSPQNAIVSFVLPGDYWNESWGLDNAESLRPFEAIVTPQSVHLVGSRLDASRWSGGVKRLLEIEVACECGDMTMQALVVP